MNPLVATVVILILTIAALLSDKLSFIVISPFIIISLLLTGVLPPGEAFSGFSNTNVVMFVAMFVVGGALVKTSLLDRIQKVVHKFKDKPKTLVFISMLVTATISLITSQTAAIVIMIPVMVGIANEMGISRSKFLYAATAAAGTSVGLTFLGQGASNMTWSSIMMEAGGKIPFTQWDFLIGRWPFVVITFIYMLTIGYRLLPDHPNEQFDDYQQAQTAKTSLTLSPAKEKLALIICSVTIIAMFLADFIGIQIFVIACIGVTLLIAIGILSDKEAVSAVHWPTVFLFAGVLPLSTALQKSGAGDVVADFMIGVLGNTTNPYVIVMFFILVPLILTQFMSDLATVAIFIPLASSVAVRIGIDPRAAVMATFVAGCINLLTPMANPAQSMIVGPGGYKFKDYLKCGTPLTIILVIVAVIYLPMVFPL